MVGEQPLRFIHMVSGFPLIYLVFLLITYPDKDEILLRKGNEAAFIHDERGCHWAATYTRLIDCKHTRLASTRNSIKFLDFNAYV